MYRFLFGLAALVSALILPLNASADTIDDFVLTGGGHTITYSLPSTTIFQYCFSCDFFYMYLTGTIDGVPGYQLTEGYGYDAIAGDLHLRLPDSIFGYDSMLFQGPNLITTTLVLSSDPMDPFDRYNYAITFIPGTYSLVGAGMQTFPYKPPGPDLPFTMTITPQTETAATPEPPSLTLLATGLFGLLGFAATRLNRIRPTP